MRYRVKGRDAISGAAIETTLEGWGLDEVERIAARKQIVSATFEQVGEDGGELVYTCTPPPVGYRPKNAAPPKALPMPPRPVATPIPFATPIASPSRDAPLTMRERLWRYRSHEATTVAAIALIALWIYAGHANAPPASSTVAPLRVATPVPVTIVPPTPAVPEPPPPMVGLFTVQYGTSAAFDKSMRERTERKLSDDGEPYCMVFWSTSSGKVRAMLAAFGNELNPRVYRMIIPHRAGDETGYFVPALARFASLANGDEDASSWSEWLRSHDSDLQLSRKSTCSTNVCRATLEWITTPEPGVSLTLISIR